MNLFIIYKPIYNQINTTINKQIVNNSYKPVFLIIIYMFMFIIHYFYVYNYT